jgi:hypothetical protein
MTTRFGAMALGVVILGTSLAGCARWSSPPLTKPPGPGEEITAKPAAEHVPSKPPDQVPSKPAVTSGGWGVGEYRVKQVKPRDEAASAALYTSDQGVVTTIESVSATPREVRPGEALNLRMDYTVLGPSRTRDIKVREVRWIFFNNQHLVDLPAKELTLRQGTNEIHDTLMLPGNAAEGSYALVMSLSVVAPGGWRQVRGQVAFAVRSQSAAGSAPPLTAGPAGTAPTPAATAPPAMSAPPATRPSTSAVAVPPPAPQVMYVHIPMANLREGAGVRHAILGRVPRGTPLDVLQTSGSGSDRWFRVRLPGGQEGWVAASAVSPSK